MIVRDGHIWFRQSWLSTALRCPEEGRLEMVNGSSGWTSDEAFIGTAAHAGIEAFINGYVDNFREMADVILDEYDSNDEAQHIKFTKRANIDEMKDYSVRCAKAWLDDIYPVMPKGGKAEVEFEVPLFEHRDFIIGIKGTADYVPASGNLIWDWKTAGSDYKQKMKQYAAIQPTFYGMAATHGGFGRTDFTWPIEFTYGVMIKRVKQCRGQLVEVQRTKNHADWAISRMKTFVNMYLDMGIDTPWPAIDEDNFLCSAKWCDHYASCRGKFITQKEDLFGYNPR